MLNIFAYCSSLTSIHIPYSVNSIERYSFYGCSSLATINISSVKNIERYSFYGCSNLTYIYIPDELNYIGEHAFDGCPIEEVTLPKSAKYYTNSFDKKTKIENLKVFISYSWESEVPFAWIDKLANDLNKKVDVILDREELGPGNSKKAFFNEIPEAHKVICVLTPEYKGKSDNGVGVLGREEYPIIKNERENERKKGIKTSKYIPLLKKGKPEESIPNELSDIIFVDFRNDEDYDESLKKLLKIFNH